MEATTNLSSTFTLLSWSASKSANLGPTFLRRRRLPGGGAVVRASSGGGSGDEAGRSVDESMVVLRMRIREMKMEEMKNNYEDVAPCDWMEWEKKYYYGGGYVEDVCGAVGLLQCYLMSVRPSFALGIVGILAVCVSISCGVALSQSLHILNTLFSIFN